MRSDVAPYISTHETPQPQRKISFAPAKRPLQQYRSRAVVYRNTKAPKCRQMRIVLVTGTKSSLASTLQRQLGFNLQTAISCGLIQLFAAPMVRGLRPGWRLCHN